MRQRRIYFLIIVGMAAAIFNMNCASHSVFTYDKLQKKQEISVTTIAGESFKGTIASIDENNMSMLNSGGQQKSLAKSDIKRITGPKPVYDESGLLISRSEIAAKKTHSHFFRYLLGGSALSFGVSFFIGSLIDRQVSDQADQGPIMWGTAGAGTVVGAALFSRMGSKKDTDMTIEKIRDQRRVAAATNLEKEKERQRLIKTELEKLEKEREQQEKEIKELNEKLKDLQ